jgi:hypothetical protein
MEKVIRDGKVAVLYSPGYGAGWYSWHRIPELIFHPKLVEMVEAGQQANITEDWILKNTEIDGESVYCGGAEDLDIQWVPVGTRFLIREYDGSESIVLEEELDLIIA